MNNAAPKIAAEPDKAEDPEIQMRESIQEALTIAGRLEPFCRTVGEFISLLEGALENDAQLRMVTNKILKPKR